MGQVVSSSRDSVVMLCTAARGGMRSVVEGYRADGFFEKQKILWLVTHSEGRSVG